MKTLCSSQHSPITFIKEDGYREGERHGSEPSYPRSVRADDGGFAFHSYERPGPHCPWREIDCEDKQPELDVHPLNEPVVEITCTVRNPSSFQESISVEKEWDGMEVDMMLGEDTFDLGPDEEEDFKVTFTGQTRLSSSISYDFTLVATVTNVGMLDWPEGLSSNASVSGDLNVATFGMVDLEISDKSTRTMHCLLYTSPSPRDRQKSRMPSSA